MMCVQMQGLQKMTKSLHKETHNSKIVQKHETLNAISEGMNGSNKKIENLCEIDAILESREEKIQKSKMVSKT